MNHEVDVSKRRVVNNCRQVIVLELNDAVPNIIEAMISIFELLRALRSEEDGNEMVAIIDYQRIKRFIDFHCLNDFRRE